MENPDLYYGIEKEGSGKYTEKMSRFLSFAVPVHDAEEAKAVVKRLQNDYHDARHVCWAYMLGPDREEYQLNDNGEPSGTAGKPILGQINSAGVTDVAVAVVRYFGGIKLGTSGLISAYREAARLALEDAGRKELFITEPLEVRFPYLSMNDVMRLVKRLDLQICSQQFDNSCVITLQVPRSRRPEIAASFADIDGTSVV